VLAAKPTTIEEVPIATKSKIIYILDEEKELFFQDDDAFIKRHR
jgi:hypothetical protein